ncbi:unnamed protein product [Sphagnum tenellum]
MLYEIDDVPKGKVSVPCSHRRKGGKDILVADNEYAILRCHYEGVGEEKHLVRNHVIYLCGMAKVPCRGK